MNTSKSIKPSQPSTIDSIILPNNFKSGSFKRAILSTVIMTAFITPLSACSVLHMIQGKETTLPKVIIGPNSNIESASIESLNSQDREEKPPFLKKGLGQLLGFVENKFPRKQSGEASNIENSSIQTMDSLVVPFVPNELSLFQAQQLLAQVSPKLAANNAAINASALQSEASESLNKPILFLRAQATHYDANTDIDLTGLKAGIDDKVGGLINTIPIPLPNLPPLSSGLPDNYNLQRSGDKVGANLVALWPVYTGGRTKTLTSILNARTSEAQADALMDSDVLYTTLVQRYFNAQLAILASDLRKDALNTVKETDFIARRLFEEGFIAKVERIEAQVALANANSEEVKARNNADLAMTALQSLLRAPDVVKPTTPLFLSSKPLLPLSYFQNIALANHPGLKKVNAKYQQAERLKKLSDTGFKPTVSLYGLHEIDKDPNWLVGISASWKLWGGLNKKAKLAAGDAKMEQASLTKLEASNNILLLVEKNWQTVENSRVHYLSLNDNVSFAQELLRLKQLGLAEGVNIALDVTTAQTKYLKARTEQAAAANDYVQALAALMESCGTPYAFNEYMDRADIRLQPLY